MPLEDIEQKLYREKFEKEDKKRAKEPPKPQFETWEKRDNRPKPITVPISVSRPKKSRHRLILVISFAVFLALIGLGLYLWYVYFPQNQVGVTLSGPKSVRAGETATYLVHYKNNTQTILNDAELTLNYPQGVVVTDEAGIGNLPFVKKSLGNIGIGSEAEETFTLLVFGEPLTTKRLEASLSYQPANLPRTRLSNSTQLDVTISALTLGLDLILPKQVLPSEEFSFTLAYRNNSDLTFPDARIAVDYPDNFTFLSSDLKASQNDNVWFLGTVGAYSEGKIEIKGVVAGQASESKEFKARIGIMRKNDFLDFREVSSSVSVTGLPLTLTSAINYSNDYVAKPGELLTVSVAYKNTGDIGLNELILRSQLIGPMMDLKSVTVDHGLFSSADNTITWNAGSLPAFKVLGPGQEGEVTFQVKLKDDYPVRTVNDKNFVIKVDSTLETETIPPYLGVTLKKISVSSETAAKVRTELRVSSMAYFRDPKGFVQNSGPLPPKVGQATTYTVYWKIVNPANDLENVIVRTTLPAGISWTGKTVVPYGAAAPVYNERTGEVTWTIDRITSGAGIISPAYEVYFQVSANPSVNQAGNLISIINETDYSGHDVFAVADLSGKVAQIRSNLPDDPTMRFELGIVAQ